MAVVQNELRAGHNAEDVKDDLDQVHTLMEKGHSCEHYAKLKHNCDDEHDSDPREPFV